MIEKDLGKVLNYMKQYVENKYEHDSEPMLNYKDLQLVLEEIERLNNIIKEVREYIKQTGQYLEDIKRFKVDVLEPDYLNLLEILDKINKENI